MQSTGKVYLVGAGPGDTELITVKGLSRLRECEAVVYDRLASDQLLDMVPDTCEKIYVGKESGNHTLIQEEINQVLVKKALEGKTVVRLKGGDPFVFGRGGEEVLALQKENIPYEVIPGITSAIAGAAYGGIPVTHRGVSQSLHIITGHTRDSANQLTDNFETLAKLEGTLVFLMGINNLDRIVEELCRYGKDKDTPAAVISNATTRNQEMVKGTLATISTIVKENEIKSPAVIIIGGVAALDMKGTIKGKLTGINIGLTGTGKLNHKIAAMLQEHGAAVDVLNYMDIKEYEPNPELEHALAALDHYTWLIFTSTNGVDIFFNRLLKHKIDFRTLSGLKFAVVGKGTEEALLKYGFQADYIPEKYTTASLAEGLTETITKKDCCLILRAERGSADLTEILSEKGITFQNVKLYDIALNQEKWERINSDFSAYDYLTFASSSGVESFFKQLKEENRKLLTHTKIVCIGEVTEKKLKEYYKGNIITAGEYSARGIAYSILADTEHKNG